MRFAFELCEILGGMTVQELLQRMSSKEIAYWMSLRSAQAEIQRRADAEKQSNKIKSAFLNFGKS